jgi:hypothetical protein
VDAAPPERRTVGQLVADAIRLYGRRFWRSLALGASLAVLDQFTVGHPVAVQLVMIWVAAPFLSASYAGAAALAAERRPSPSSVLRAVAIGTLLLIPAPVLAFGYVLPAVAWLAFVGLAVPAAVIEGGGVWASILRGTRLARADFVHALGSIATLLILYFIARFGLILLLQNQADATSRVALFLGDLIVSPLVFLGSALLYFDQASRHHGGHGSSVPRR